MKVTPTAFRKDLYALLDGVIATGEPLEIERNGVTLEVKAKHKESRLDRVRQLGQKDLWTGAREDIFSTDWLEEWREEWGLEEDEMRSQEPSISTPMRPSGSVSAIRAGSRRKRNKR